MKKIRTLKANEIEVRPQSVKDGKVTLLLYIDSRAATDLLDETYGMENWTIEYRDVAGQIYGRLSIYDKDNNRWIFREDTGSPANIEKEKSLASDIVKRCIVRFGVTELYSTPRVQVTDDGYGNSGYKVSEINYNENREIIHLVIVNRFDKEVFRWDINTTTKEVAKPIVNTPKEDKIDLKEELKKFVIANHTLENTEQIKKFHSYYLNILNSKGWQGNMDLQKLFNNWMSRAYNN